MPHQVKRTLTEIVVVHDHDERKESAEFRKTKARLKKDGHYRCWVCGSTEDLQAHHFGCEWSLQDQCDFEKLKAFCEEWDPYGYGRLLRNQPITSVDDIRNVLMLCREHHLSGDIDGVANGIHDITFPIWISQKLAKEGEDPVPEDAAELQEEMRDGDVSAEK